MDNFETAQYQAELNNLRDENYRLKEQKMGKYIDKIKELQSEINRLQTKAQKEYNLKITPDYVRREDYFKQIKEAAQLRRQLVRLESAVEDVKYNEGKYLKYFCKNLNTLFDVEADMWGAI